MLVLGNQFAYHLLKRGKVSKSKYPVDLKRVAKVYSNNLIQSVENSFGN